MCRSNRHSAHHFVTVIGMELVTLCQFYRLWEGIPFSSIGRECLWKLVRHYRIPEKIINIIQNSYEGLTCIVMNNGRLPCVKWCKTKLSSSFLFFLAIDWIMKQSTSQKKKWNTMDIQATTGQHGFCWWFGSPVPHPTADARKDEYCAGTLNPSRLNIHRWKSKILKVHSTSTVSIILGLEAIENIYHFTYLGSVIDTQGGTKADVKARISKARAAFLQLKNIWKSNVLHWKTRSGFSIQMSKLFFFMEQRHGGSQWSQAQSDEKWLKWPKIVCGMGDPDRRHHFGSPWMV